MNDKSQSTIFLFFNYLFIYLLIANAAFLGLMAADAGIQPTANRQWAASQIDYMLGDNPRSSSYVVGFGNNYPKEPHHRAA